MQLGGLQAVTLLDFPGKVACTVFTQACNFRCHYCHNPELVIPERFGEGKHLSEEEFFDFLTERKKFLEGVCITGGEPTLQHDLYDFIKKIKEMGFAVKLDTNGTNPELLAKLLSDSLVDYVAMDIKQCPDKYYDIVNVDVDIAKIKESVELLKNSQVNYEFRTTVMWPLISEEDIYQIVDWLAGAKVYNLQWARTGMDLVNADYSSRKNEITKSDLAKIHEKIKGKFEKSELR